MTAGLPTSGGCRRAGRFRGEVDTERAFLALCIAAPEEGETALRGLDVEKLFSTELLRRAALPTCAREAWRCRWRRRPGRAQRCGAGPRELRSLRAARRADRAGGRRNTQPGMLEVQRLQLELAGGSRGYSARRGPEGRDVTVLARARAALKAEFDRAYSVVLEQTGERGV